MRAACCEATVLSHEVVQEDIRLLRVHWPDAEHAPHAGQFFTLRSWPAEEGPFLSRPISVHKWEPETLTVEFLYQVIGEGTQKLATLKPGDTFQLTGPMGNGFDIPTLAAQYKKIAVVGGGIGTAPMYQVARELAAARYEMEVAEGQRRTAQDAVLKLQGQADHYRSTLESLERSRESLEGERQALDQRVADSRRQMEETGGEIARQDAEAAALRTQAEEKLAGQTDLLALSGKLSEDVSARKEELSALAAEKEATAKALADMEQVCRDMEGDRLTRQRRLEEYRAAIEATEGEIDRRTEAAASLRLRGKGCQDRLTALREAKLLLEQERSAMGARIKSCNDAVLAAEREVARLEQKLSAGQWEEKQLLDKLWETYELSHSAAMAQRIELESVPKANRRINELKREIGGLGNVNLEAIEDFDRINTRYTYLTGQRDDVEKAKGELVGVIEDLTREMTGIFARQFKLIDEAFRDTFRDLFGGGQARLELEDPEHVLDCGIDIKAQPPGKAMKSLEPLSGGEKAVVAIALYFAILKVHPTPFCVMDEIDASLDDANVVRFARYMRSIADKTQFIVITHRRGTMEEADILYGVTMQEEGVSKMLTINMNDVAKELKIK